MRLASRLIAFSLATCCLVSTQALADRILGSGSTFVYPVMAAWSQAYQKQEGVELSYQAIGSSGGVRELRAGLVEFAISDAPLKPEELAAHDFVQFPIVTGGIVPRGERRRYPVGSTEVYRSTAGGHLSRQG
jgi:phosphate transport system substrate-binding protein